MDARQGLCRPRSVHNPAVVRSFGDSPIAFVGTATEQRRGYTRLAVDQVLVGPDLAPEVWVRTGQEQPPWPLSGTSSVSSSVDAGLEPGVAYVVGAYVGARDELVTDACSVRPAEASELAGDRPPTPDGLVGAGVPLGPVGQVATVAGLLAALAALAPVVRRGGRAL